MARLFTHKIRHVASLPNTYDLEKTTDVITKLKNTPILPHFSLAPIDITNLYTIIPVTDIREIIAKVLEENISIPQNP